MRYEMILLAALALAGCESAQKAAEYAATRDLADPASAQFRNVRINHEGVVCGEVSGKARTGRMTGFRDFMYYSHTGHHLAQPADIDRAKLEQATLLCRTAAGADGGRSACAIAASLTQAHRRATDFRDRFTIDCR